MRENAVLNKRFLFALKMIKAYKYLAEERREFVVSKQLLRSGTAVGALVREAQNAESKMDLVHKLGISKRNVMKQSIGWNYCFNPNTWIN